MRNSKTTKRSLRAARPSDLLRVLKAVSSPVRLKILELLKNPVANFPPQVDGDRVRDGVCADFIRKKLGIAPATASRHLTLLSDAGLLMVTPRKGWMFYRRNEHALRRFARTLESQLVRLAQ